MMFLRSLLIFVYAISTEALACAVGTGGRCIVEGGLHNRYAQRIAKAGA